MATILYSDDRRSFAVIEDVLYTQCIEIDHLDDSVPPNDLSRIRWIVYRMRMAKHLTRPAIISCIFDIPELTRWYESAAVILETTGPETASLQSGYVNF
jgi:hypothetical protein